MTVEAMLLDRLQRRLCLLTCDRSSMMGTQGVGVGRDDAVQSSLLPGNASVSAAARLWRIEQYNYVNGELINTLNVPLGSSNQHPHQSRAAAISSNAPSLHPLRRYSRRGA